MAASPYASYSMHGWVPASAVDAGTPHRSASKCLCSRVMRCSCQKGGGTKWTVKVRGLQQQQQQQRQRVSYQACAFAGDSRQHLACKASKQRHRCWLL
jgi:uncharacterized protein involved in copper resistance